MPIYTIHDKNTGEEKDEFFSSHDALESHLEKNIHLERRFKGVPLISQHGGLKIADGFNDLLKGVKAGSGSGCTIKHR